MNPKSIIKLTISVSSDGQQRPHDQNQCGFEWSSANAVISGTSFGDSLYKEPKQNRTMHCIHQEPGFWKVLSCPPTGILGFCVETQGVTGWARPKLQQRLGEKGDRLLCWGNGADCHSAFMPVTRKTSAFLEKQEKPKAENNL